MAFLILIQKGNHLAEKHLATRIMSLTTAMLTLVMFIYYSTNVTAKMIMKHHAIKLERVKRIFMPCISGVF